MAADVPVVTTPRLTLRGFTDADLDVYASWLADERTAMYLGGKTLDRADAWRSMAMMVGHWALRGYGMWAVVDDQGQLVGRVGLWNPEGWPAIECGWLIGPAHRNRGYATEAARAAIEWGRVQLGLARIISIIHVDNEPSIRTARALGEVFAEERTLRGFPCAIYAKDLA